jgi:hypothetical protein
MNNQITVNEIDKAVSEYLKSRGVLSYKTIHVSDNAENKEWPCDVWRVVFTAQNHNEFVTEFRTGLGHRLTNLRFGKLSASQINGSKVLKEVTGMDRSCFKIDDYTYTVAPTQASVLYCLLSDADCGNYTFDEFCDNLGYDNDSRKALETYLCCQETNTKLNKFFSRGTINHLQELLQDY